ncbi:Origin recognition complex, subunit 1 [Basidiobolus ranarum]|uniref:Origin recognition complex subunit 1 n=1 Tax=Basidiobolus ranarum TaxID=34480 RepID=A0ABR2WX01_9FUNG
MSKRSTKIIDYSNECSDGKPEELDVVVEHLQKEFNLWRPFRKTDLKVESCEEEYLPKYKRRDVFVVDYGREENNIPPPEPIMMAWKPPILPKLPRKILPRPILPNLSQSNKVIPGVVTNPSVSPPVIPSLSQLNKVTPGRATKSPASLPVISTRKLVSNDPVSDFEKARQKLHVSSIPDTLPCREDEFCEILAYLESALEDQTGGCIYISGVPGTGKTATVHEVIRSLQTRVEDGDLEPFQFIEINGMKLTEPSHAYSVLWKALTGENVTAKHAADLLEHTFSSPSTRTQPCLVLMDELDLLVTRKQTVMYNFFEWPNRPNTKLIVIAIANTMDLPERLLSNKVSSRLGLTRINFQPYTHNQLYTIIQSRLQDSGTFESDAIEFCARKVSAVSGDARRALDICRRAVELVEHAHQRNEATQDGTAISQVTIGMVDRAVKEMFVTSNIQFIHNATLHQKLFLVALVARLKKRGLPEVEFTHVSFIRI